MKNIFRIVQLARPLYGVVALIAILIVIGAALELVAPILSKSIIDEIVAKVSGTGGSVERLAFLIGLVFVLNIVGLIASTLSERLGDHFAGKLRKFLTEKFYYKVLTLPQSYFDSEISGKIVHQLNRGIFSIQNFINSSTNFILPTILQSVFTIAVLAYYNPVIAFFTFLLFPVYLGLSVYSTKKWGEEEVKKNKIEDATRGRISEVIGNMSLVKGFNAQLSEFKFISSNLSKSNTIYAKQSKTFHIFDFLRGLSLNIILLIINIVAFYQTFQGNLSIGSLVLIIQLVAQARRPLFAMSFILTQVQSAESGSKEFFEILTLPSKEDIETSVKAEKVEDPTIRFENVNFHYEKENKVLKGLSFDLHKNETVALVGHSGAGKSTIVNLILKFYEPTGGEIYLKDMPYSSLDHAFVRENISLVYQNSELFSATILENVMYGSKASEEDVVEALKLAHAYEFVSKLPKGIHSEIGERGVKLSGGQKQRIQIARAILKNAPILILDEATSSLDAKSEKEVQDALENLMKNKLVLIIAHRFSTIQNVNKIIVIDSGTIADIGTPQELATKPGIYHDLLSYQVAGNRKLLESYDIF